MKYNLAVKWHAIHSVPAIYMSQLAWLVIKNNIFVIYSYDVKYTVTDLHFTDVFFHVEPFHSQVILFDDCVSR